MLDRYARELELSRPKLCALLILRSVRLDQLGSLNRDYARPEPKKKAIRITARVGKELKNRFTAAAARLGLGSDEAAAMVFRAELEERWLEKMIISR
ncbi:hypothetical protein [Sphingomonas hengshuiensis]|nr:hypothetical protein [Sphingomonas hengshuiensis]